VDLSALKQFLEDIGNEKVSVSLTRQTQLKVLEQGNDSAGVVERRHAKKKC